MAFIPRSTVLVMSPECGSAGDNDEGRAASCESPRTYKHRRVKLLPPDCSSVACFAHRARLQHPLVSPQIDPSRFAQINLSQGQLSSLPCHMSLHHKSQKAGPIQVGKLRHKELRGWGSASVSKPMLLTLCISSSLPGPAACDSI